MDRALRQYALVTGSYWAFTLTDGIERQNDESFSRKVEDGSLIDSCAKSPSAVSAAVKNGRRPPGQSVGNEHRRGYVNLRLGLKDELFDPKAGALDRADDLCPELRPDRKGSDQLAQHLSHGPLPGPPSGRCLDRCNRLAALIQKGEGGVAQMTIKGIFRTTPPRLFGNRNRLATGRWLDSKQWDDPQRQQKLAG